MQKAKHSMPGISPAIGSSTTFNALYDDGFEEKWLFPMLQFPVTCHKVPEQAQEKSYPSCMLGLSCQSSCHEDRTPWFRAQQPCHLLYLSSPLNLRCSSSALASHLPD